MEGVLDLQSGHRLSGVGVYRCLWCRVYCDSGVALKCGVRDFAQQGPPDLLQDGVMEEVLDLQFVTNCQKQGKHGV